MTTNQTSGTMKDDKTVRYDIRKNKKEKYQKKYQKLPEKYEIEIKHNTHTSHQNHSVPPLEASTRRLEVCLGVIYYMKPNERGCTLVDDKSRNLSCFVILLCDCNIL